MNISKALKTKNRLAGELAKVRAILSRENSKRSTDKISVDRAEVEARAQQLTAELIALKSALSKASAPISDKLAAMAELKSESAWLKTLDIKEGKVSVRFAAEPTEEEWTAYINEPDRDRRLDELQKKMDALQDEVDEYNAQTSI